MSWTSFVESSSNGGDVGVTCYILWGFRYDKPLRFDVGSLVLIGAP